MYFDQLSGARTTRISYNDNSINNLQLNFSDLLCLTKKILNGQTSENIKKLQHRMFQCYSFIMHFGTTIYISKWNVKPLLGHFGGRVGFCGIL